MLWKLHIVLKFCNTNPDRSTLLQFHHVYFAEFIYRQQSNVNICKNSKMYPKIKYQSFYFIFCSLLLEVKIQTGEEIQDHFYVYIFIIIFIICYYMQLLFNLEFNRHAPEIRSTLSEPHAICLLRHSKSQLNMSMFTKYFHQEFLI